MTSYKKIENNISTIIFSSIVFLVTLTTVLPFVWMISTSFKIEADVFNFPIEWIPQRWNIIENYSEIFTGKYNFALFYMNTVKIAILATAAQVTVSAMGAYGFSKIRFKFRDAIFLLYISTLMISEQVTLIPRFMVFKWLNLFNTHLGLVLLLTFSTYGIFLLRQFMITIPESLSESAKLDGASHFRIFWQIIFPLTKPAIATLATLKFVWTWNDYQHPLVFLSSRHLFVIQQGIRQFASESGQFFALTMTAAVIATVPLIIVFIFFQRYIIAGITVGAIKG